jgi:putative endonuclease
MSLRQTEFGKTGEDLACRELARRGYAILARRYRRRGGELDIVARDGPTIVFVEVKTRHDRTFGSAEESVGFVKRRRIVRVAREFVVEHRLADRPCRFDVVTIHFGAGRPEIELFQNAFDVSGR